MKARELDGWFRGLGSQELADLFPSLFEEIMESAAPERCTINDFIREAKARWKAMTADEKRSAYQSAIG